MVAMTSHVNTIRQTILPVCPRISLAPETLSCYVLRQVDHGSIILSHSGVEIHRCPMRAVFPGRQPGIQLPVLQTYRSKHKAKRLTS